MQKKNRIFMRIVAALLVLVLFTTCLLSSVYARFVVKKSFSMNATFTQLGVEVGLNIEGNLLTALGGEEAVAGMMTINGGSMTITIPAGALKMAPGDDFSDDIKVSLSGTAGTRLKIMMKTEVAFVDPDKTDDDSPFKTLDGKNYFPIGFYVTAKNTDGDSELSCLHSAGISTTSDSTVISGFHNIYLAPYLGMDCLFDWSNMYATAYCNKEFEKGSNIVLHPEDSSENPVETVNINEFAIGFRWPFDKNDHKVMLGTVSDAHNMNSKYDTEVIGDSFTYSFTITVEQLPKETEAA